MNSTSNSTSRLAVDLLSQDAMLKVVCQFIRAAIRCYECKFKWSFLRLPPSYLLVPWYLVTQICQFCSVN